MPHPAPTADDETALALRAWIALARAYNAVAERAAADVARHDLTPAEFGVLEALHHRGPMLLGEVQRRILVSSGGITYLVDRLEKRGLVERRDCPGDRRARFAALTDAGAQLVNSIFPEHAAVIRDALASLSRDDKREAIRLLRTVIRGAAGASTETEQVGGGKSVPRRAQIPGRAESPRPPHSR